MPSHSVRECLIGEHFAPAQQMPVQVYDATEPSDGDIIGDWEVKGVFCNFALERDGSMVPQEADNAWLEGALEGYHCRYVVELVDG